MQVRRLGGEIAVPWKVFKFVNNKQEFVGEIDEPADCMGDDLYAAMEENGWIESIDDYDVDGDSEHVAVMHKDGSKPDFSLEFASKVQ